MVYKICSTCTLVFLMLSACSVLNRTSEPTVPVSCTIEDLIVDSKLLPQGWSQQGLPRARAAPVRWGVEKLGVTFIAQESGVALQEVYRGESLSQTEDAYSDLVISWFTVNEDETEWYTPREVNYRSSVAGSYRFGCTTHKPSGVERCQFVGLYRTYLVRFHTDMSSIMTYDDLEQILQDIEDKMAQCFDLTFMITDTDFSSLTR